MCLCAFLPAPFHLPRPPPVSTCCVLLGANFVEAERGRQPGQGQVKQQDHYCDPHAVPRRPRHYRVGLEQPEAQSGPFLHFSCPWSQLHNQGMHHNYNRSHNRTSHSLPLVLAPTPNDLKCISDPLDSPVVHDTLFLLRQSLNICGNMLGDAGAREIASMLQYNQVLSANS